MHPSCHEILYITEGKVRFRWRDNLCEAEAPAVFVLAASTPHGLESVHAESKFRFAEIEEGDDFPLSEKQVDEWNFIQARKGIYSKTLLASSILQSLDFVYHLQATGAARQDSNLEDVCLLEIRKIYKLIAHVLGGTGTGLPAGRRAAKHKSRVAVDLLIDYMDWRYQEEITLETLADLVQLDPSYLVRVFKQHKNTTPFGYLRDLRLKAAASYLSGSDLPISAIVQESGFNSVHYFTRLFKQHYGQSPAEWRKQLKQTGKS